MSITLIARHFGDVFVGIGHGCEGCNRKIIQGGCGDCWWWSLWNGNGADAREEGVDEYFGDRADTVSRLLRSECRVRVSHYHYHYSTLLLILWYYLYTYRWWIDSLLCYTATTVEFRITRIGLQMCA